MEDDLRWKTTFGGRRPRVEDKLRWKTTFGGRQSLHAVAYCLSPNIKMGAVFSHKLFDKVKNICFNSEILKRKKI